MGVAALVVASGCGEEPPAPLAAEEPAPAVEEASLTLAQCNYEEFQDRRGRVRVCHYAQRRTRAKYVMVKVTPEECEDHIEEHVEGYPDFVAVGDSNCSGDGCLPLNAPCDPTVPCCDGLTCAMSSDPAAAAAGPHCVDVDACENNPCGDHEECIDKPWPAGDDADGRICNCAPGFEREQPASEGGHDDFDWFWGAGYSWAESWNPACDHPGSDHDDAHGHRGHGRRCGCWSHRHRRRHHHDGEGQCVASCTLQPGLCDDGDVCNGLETCSAELGCVAGEAPIIDDGNDCTEDTCDPVDGVTHTNLAAGAACGSDAESVCDLADTCDGAGVCEANYVPAGTECRAASGLCDVPEACDGAGACPEDGFVEAGAVCRSGSGDLCDPDETCTGDAAACPADVVASADTVCNPGSGDVCDPDELCTGVAGATCPDDSIADATTVCRSGSGDVCDPDETCTGQADAACPADVVASADTVCNPGSGDICDPDELCTGVAGASCPADTIADADTVCRSGSGDLCDPDETCTGQADAACPDDVVASADTVCNPGSGDVCDPDELCTGVAGATCPDDTIADADTVCRSGSGDVCDPDETCTGQADAACPVDVVASSDTVCNPGSGDICDPDELCTGVAGATCPGDSVADATTVCRSGSGDLCDPDETCIGQADAACPADVVASADTVCNPGSGDACDPDELCTGVAGATCPDDSIADATTVCRSGSGDLCDPDETCTGQADAACPADVVASADTVCNPGSGDICDPDELCTGVAGATCPDDSFADATTVCRSGSGDLCDPDETCTGQADAACPDDVVASVDTVCNPGSGDVCDPDELCTGVAGASCPADSIADATTVCRSGSGDLCDPDETCTGQADAACPADVVASADTVCNPGSGDVCDPDELCTGVAGATCPDDTIADADTVCRSGSGDLCDPDETCTGQADAACPADVVASADTVCNPGSGDICDPDELCIGVAGATCPDDSIADATTVCRSGSGDVCDPDETCTGQADAACPADVVASADTVCNPGSGDVCDPDELCTGVAGATCPDDTIADADTVCRSGSGDLCDPDETCTGQADAACPADVVASADTVCNPGSGDVCDPDELCTGVAGATCPDDSFADATTVCRAGSGDLCDPDETCTGQADAACPADVVASADTVCNPGSGDVCDPDELCTGVAGATCPDDSIADATTVCRSGSGDLCDPDETCTGQADAACPADVVASADTVCNPGSGDVCDPDELCTGVAGATCPDDSFADATTVCRSGSGDLCDPDETCTGQADAACPADVIADAGTVCHPGDGTGCDLDEVCSGAAGQSCPADLGPVGACGNQPPPAPAAPTITVAGGAALDINAEELPLTCASDPATLGADPEGDDVTADVAWTFGGETVLVASDLPTASHTTTLATLTGALGFGRAAEGDRVGCFVRASDGQDASAWVAAPERTVANGRPVVAAPALSPADPVYAYDGLTLFTCTAGDAWDPDGDATSLRLAWYLNGAPLEGTPVEPGFSADLLLDVAVGDEVTCAVYGGDAGGEGAPGVTARTIANHVPRCLSATITPEQATYADTDTVTCACAEVEDFDGDVSDATCSWTDQNGVPLPITGCSAALTDVPVGYAAVCTAVPADFAGPGEGAAAPAVPRAGNQPPEFSTEFPTPFGILTPNGEAELEAFVATELRYESAVAVDPEGAPVHYQLTWIYRPAGGTDLTWTTPLDVTTITPGELAANLGVTPSVGDIVIADEVHATDGLATTAYACLGAFSAAPAAAMTGDRDGTTRGGAITCSYQGANPNVAIAVVSLDASGESTALIANGAPGERDFTWRAPADAALGEYACVGLPDLGTLYNADGWWGFTVSANGPRLDAITLSPGSTDACSARQCKVTVFHPDVDAGLVDRARYQLEVSWLVNGAVARTDLHDRGNNQPTRTHTVNDPGLHVAAGDEVSCSVVARGSDVAASGPIASSASTVTVAAAVGAVTLSQPGRVGEPVRCLTPDWDPGCAADPHLVYTWYDRDALIEGEDGPVLTDSRKGQLLNCEVWIVDGDRVVSRKVRSNNNRQVAQPVYTITSGVQRLLFGESLAVLPDRREYGTDALVIGAPGGGLAEGLKDAGRVYVEQGRLGSVDRTVDDFDFGVTAWMIDGDEGGWASDAPCVGVPASYCNGTPRPGQVIDGGLRGPTGGGLGFAVATVDDVNGDGLNDIVAGAPWGTSADGAYYAGRLHVIDGAPLRIRDLDARAVHDVGEETLALAYGEQGVDPVLWVEEDAYTRGGAARYNGHLLGYGVAGGDFDGDGRGDIAAGAINAEPDDADDTQYDNGRVYVVTGAGGERVVDLTAFRNPATRSGDSGGFVVDGDRSGDFVNNGGMGVLVNLGDVNADGRDDLLIDPESFVSSALYLVFGRSGAAPLNAVSGDDDGILRLETDKVWTTYLNDDDYLRQLTSGRSLLHHTTFRVGDVNADGVDDVLVPSVENEGQNQFEVAVLFGRPGLDRLDIAGADQGRGGYVIEGRPGGGYATAGLMVGGVGDVNHDGYDDVGVRMRVKVGGSNTFRLYIAYGKADTTRLTFAELEVGVGGEVRQIDYLARAMTPLDYDGDGLSDIALGNGNANNYHGWVQVQFGRDLDGALTGHGGDDDDTLGDPTGDNRVAGGLGDDTIVGGAGPDVLYGGGGDDTISVGSLAFRRVDGGNGEDTLVLPAGDTDLAALSSRVRNVERFALAADGTLRLSLGAVARASNSSNTVTVLGDATNGVVLSGGAWARGGDEGEGDLTFAVYRAGGAVVRLQEGVALTSPPALANLDFEIAEDATPGTSVGELQASDPDGDVLYVEVVEPGSAFTVVDGDTLVVAEGAALDRETKPAHVFPVRVTDATGLHAVYFVTVALIDVDEAPVFPDDAPTATVEEGAEPGTLVTTLAAFDGDLGEVLTYTLRAGDPDGAFALDPATGALTVDRWKLLDFEDKPEWRLRVRATDRGGLYGEAWLTVFVQDAATLRRGTSHRYIANGLDPWGGADDTFVSFEHRQEVAWYDEITQPAPNLEGSGGFFNLQYDGEPRFVGKAGGVLLNKWVAEATGGDLNVDLPVTVDFDLPDEAAPGQTLQIGGAWTLDDGARFSGRSPGFVAAALVGIAGAQFRLDLVFIGDDPVQCDTYLKPPGTSDEHWCAQQELQCADGVDNDGDAGELCIDIEPTKAVLAAAKNLTVGPDYCDVGGVPDPDCFDTDLICENDGICLGSGLECTATDCTDDDCELAPICAGTVGDVTVNVFNVPTDSLQPRSFTQIEQPQATSSQMFRAAHGESATVGSDTRLQMLYPLAGDDDVVSRPNLLLPTSLAQKTLTNRVNLEDVAAELTGLNGASGIDFGGEISIGETHTGLSGISELRTIFQHGYFIEVEGVDARFVFEDGSTQTRPVDAAMAVDLPPGADADGDGRADITVNLAVRARVYNQLLTTNDTSVLVRIGRATVGLLAYSTITGTQEVLVEQVFGWALSPPQKNNRFVQPVGGVSFLLQGIPAGVLTTSIDLTDAPGAEVCDNGADDDEDGLTDCADPECADVVCSAEGRCVAGACVDACGGCDDGIPCTEDACDAAARTCSYVPNDSFCQDNGFLCDGDEICVPGQGCGHSGNPCGAGTTCDPVAYECAADVPTDPALVGAAGDSISRAFAAPCTSGTVADGLLCVWEGQVSGIPLGGDYPEYSWSTGTEPEVYSMAQRVADALDVEVAAGVNEAISGKTWAQFPRMARRLCEAPVKPGTITVLLGGNDICIPTRVKDMPTVESLVGYMREGLEILTSCLTPDTTIQWISMPRADLLYEAGLEKERAPCPADEYVSCRWNWEQLNLCHIVTLEDDPTVRAAFGRQVDRLNQGLAEEVARWAAGEDGRNPNGVPIVGDWIGSIDEGFTNTSFGTGVFGACDIGPMDCFHPSFLGQNNLACNGWKTHPLNPDPDAEVCEPIRLCGDGIHQADWGEQCEADAHCGAGEVCNGFCLCVAADATDCETVADCPSDHGCYDGRCYPSDAPPPGIPTACGGEGERACCVLERDNLLLDSGCEPGLIEVFGCDGDCACGAGPGDSVGTCAKPTPCGGVGQRACCVVEADDPCEPGLVEIDGCAGDCFCGASLTGIVDDDTLGTSSGTCVDLSAPMSEPSIGWTAPAVGAPAPECPLRGYADAHAHLFGHMAHGGAVIAGRPWAQGGVEEALGQCFGTHDDIVEGHSHLTLDGPAAGDGGCGSFTHQAGEAILVGMADHCPEWLGDGCGTAPLHGCHGLNDEPVGSFVGTRDGAVSHLGAPAFNGWPLWSSTTHQQMYYRWLERAWRGGLRLVTQLAVTNEAMCRGSRHKAGVDCTDSMASIDEQLQAAWEMQAYIDGQHGGDGWFRIVQSPEEARQVIADGKLAVVLGIEVDNLFNCKYGAEDVCTPAYVRAQVDHYYDLGVRHIFPVHNFDNAFGGAATWQDSIEVGNRVSEGHWWSTRDCSGEGYGFSLGTMTQLAVAMLKYNDAIDPQELAALLVTRELGIVDGTLLDLALMALTGELPRPPGDRADCNVLGMSSLGDVLLDALMDKGMVIDVDHMSAYAIDDTLDRAEARVSATHPDGYPLVITHALFAELHTPDIRHERMRTPEQLQRLAALGGLVAPMLKDDVLDTPLRGGRKTIDYADSGVGDDCRHSSKTFAQAVTYAADLVGGPVALGSDFNGVAGHFGPRFGDDACGGDATERSAQLRRGDRLEYPFTLEGFGTFDRQVTGQRTFDYNVDGLAHVGLLPDFVADLVRIGLTEAQLKPIFQGAQAYVDSWDRAAGTYVPAVASCAPLEIVTDASCQATVADVLGALHGNPAVDATVSPAGPFGPGVHTVDITVTDLCGDAGTTQCSREVTIIGGAGCP